MSFLLSHCIFLLSLRIYPTVLKPLFRHRAVSTTGACSGRCYSSKNHLLAFSNRHWQRNTRRAFGSLTKPTGATFSRSAFTKNFALSGSFGRGLRARRCDHRPQRAILELDGWVALFIDWLWAVAPWVAFVAHAIYLYLTSYATSLRLAKITFISIW